MKLKKIIPYNRKLKEPARQLRKNSTLSEVLLWGYLKGKQMLCYDFDRQKPINNYIVDFFCNELMLAIEIDGDTHDFKIEEDIIRQQRLENLGIRFLRFTDKDVKQNIEGVVTNIENWIREHTPNPSQEGIKKTNSTVKESHKFNTLEGNIDENHNQEGIALVVTLLALVLITAIVVEFSYGVYTSTNNLYNWRDSQRLSIMAKSGVNVSAKYLLDILGRYSYSYPGSMELPVENPFEDFNGTIIVRIEDETSKFNINSLVPDNQIVNESDENSAYNSFKRLLKVLSLDEKIADRIVDWIDTNSESRLPDSEAGAKNSRLVSVDEILLINGISSKDYDKLLPYITVYGNWRSTQININGAEKPVLRCLSENITEELAQRVIDYRKIKPFEEKSELLNKVTGFNSLIYNPISANITTMGENFSIKSTAASGGVKRIIETVLDTSQAKIRYWKEY